MVVQAQGFPPIAMWKLPRGRKPAQCGCRERPWYGRPADGIPFLAAEFQSPFIAKASTDIDAATRGDRELAREKRAPELGRVERGPLAKLDWLARAGRKRLHPGERRDGRDVAVP
jgi:hypothetical protein